MDILDGVPDYHGSRVMPLVEAAIHVRYQDPILPPRLDAKEVEDSDSHWEILNGGSHLLQEVP